MYLILIWFIVVLSVLKFALGNVQKECLIKLRTIKISENQFYTVVLLMNDIVVKLILSMKTLNDLQTSMFGSLGTILGDPGAVSRVDKMFVVKVYC